MYNIKVCIQLKCLQIGPYHIVRIYNRFVIAEWFKAMIKKKLLTLILHCNCELQGGAEKMDR